MSDLDHYLFYDHGWNARVDGRPFVADAAQSWRDGWKDCDEDIAAGNAPVKQD